MNEPYPVAEDPNPMPSLKGPLGALALMPVFWTLMYAMADGDGSGTGGRRAAIRMVMRFFAELLGPTGCVLAGIATTAGAAYWVWRTMREQAQWKEQARREAIRERQRFAQARNQALSRPDA
jgi:hypothetical protein